MSGKQWQHNLQNSNAGYMKFNIYNTGKHNLDFLYLVIIQIFVAEKVSNASNIKNIVNYEMYKYNNSSKSQYSHVLSNHVLK